MENSIIVGSMYYKFLYTEICCSFKDYFNVLAIIKQNNSINMDSLGMLIVEQIVWIS